ncbi:phosphoadenylyl-sulfate reductase [Pleionea sp. CnH1-48]|uniref:phosphoadenylyl-sulfate reductase n=1 Tax=Pleionea sp. CnH1-48 TaxID=2954494 RepID=UPI002097A413|nr:phosphoadenylyl-sulfate reductase [Pleionea sp. CnH1-48]MCO7226883.1 phosphoadenylyl-sulfate reductase [Pleionea sp. CnH1-48]
MGSYCLQQKALTVEEFDFAQANTRLASMTAQQRVDWALDTLPGHHVLASSFGAQSAVSLHLLTQALPDIPVMLIDTGYLFSETYQFIDQLAERLKLNLKVFRSPITPAWQEARYGQLWEQGVEGIERYNQLNKVEPMQQALEELQCSTWFAGLRRDQSNSRKHIDFVRAQQQRFKVHPIADWSNRDLHYYLKQHDLPYHPLWEKGYVSIGDVHTTRPFAAGMSEEETRFFGLKRECGIHEI